MALDMDKLIAGSVPAPSSVPEVPVFEIVKYDKPFHLWEIDPHEMPDGIYEPFPFTISLTPEQESLLTQMRVDFSREIIGLVPRYVKFLQENPKPAPIRASADPAKAKRAKKKRGKGRAKRTRSQEEIIWNRQFRDFENSIKADLTRIGWPARLANDIMKTAHGKLKAHDKAAQRHLKLARQRHSSLHTDKTHAAVQYWESRLKYNHLTIGDQGALAVMASCSKQLKGNLSPVVRKQLEEKLAKATLNWQNSRLFNIACTGGKSEGAWRNKTIFLRKIGDKIEMVIKYPKHLCPGHKGRQLPQMVVPVKISDRSRKLWDFALEKKKALTFTLMPHKPGRWRITGVFKEPLAKKIKAIPNKRVGIDQNAGFITVALVYGRKLLWVRKYRIPQKGSHEEHEERIGEVMKELCAIATRERAIIVVEDLHLAHRVKYMKGRCTRRHVSRIPYRLLQSILGRQCCRTGITLHVVNPANTSVDARYRLPGMNVHLGAAAMVAWRDIGEDDIEIFQVGRDRLRIQGEDSPLLVEVQEGMPLLLKKLADPRQRNRFYRFIDAKNSLDAREERVQATGGESVDGSPTASGQPHGGEARVGSPMSRAVHAAMRPAAGAGPLVVAVRLSRTPTRRAKMEKQA